MIQQLKFKGKDDEFFFISDLHHHHDRDFIWGKRSKPNSQEKYRSVQESDEEVTVAWNSTVNHEATVFHLGDYIFADPDGSRFIALCAKLNFKHLYLLWGNHISGQRQAYFNALKAQYGFNPGEAEVYPLHTQVAGKTVTFLPAYVETIINNKPIVLSHYPIRSFNGLSKGAWHLCGHSHGGCAMSNKNTGEGFILDVGVESFGRPVSFGEIRRHFSGREIVTVDHH
jgi:calcineurin-like phosphoesterase family protein